MTRRKRSDFRPGEMFYGPHAPWQHPADVMVVIDDKYEVGFWTGGKTCYGDMMADVWMEVA